VLQLAVAEPCAILHEQREAGAGADAQHRRRLEGKGERLLDAG
jgi:hypothetical protein